MKNLYLKVIMITICLTATSATVFAQYGKDYRGLGDKAFANKDYYEAAYYYKKSAEGMHVRAEVEVPYQNISLKQKTSINTDVNYVSYQLAESYRLYENYTEAESWYYKVKNADEKLKYPLTTLWYGVCLRANQKFDAAIVQLNRFLAYYKSPDAYTALANKEINTCQYALKQYKYPHLLTITKLAGDWNEDGSDYAIVKKDDGYWFTSSRLVKDDKLHVNRIYTAANLTSVPQMVPLTEIPDSKKTPLPKWLKTFAKADDKKKVVEYGTPALTPDGKRMYLTKWFKTGAKTTYAICISELTGDTWSPVKKMNTSVNAEGYNAIQPFVTSDGKKLFFSSNKPGGQGGNDIWMSDLGADGDALNAVNLGKVINSPLDEQAPYYNVSQNKLIYSSKGFTGFGGFDFFVSTGSDGSWTKPQNMGYPMNSAKDDLYYYPDKTVKGKAYISSDRQSECCLNLFEIYNSAFTMAGTVTDCETHLPLTGVKISFIDSLDKTEITEKTTAVDGVYNYPIETKRPFSIMLEKQGYFTKILPVQLTGTSRNDTLFTDLCLQGFVKDKPIVIENILFDFNQDSLRTESKLTLNGLVTIMKDNPSISVELSAHTDSIGKDDYNMKLSQARAQSCVNYIISSGIEEKRITAKGYGKTKPIAPNSLPDGKDNPAGRQLNRRTEFTVTKVEQ